MSFMAVKEGVLAKNEDFDPEIKNVFRVKKVFRDTRRVLLDPSDSF